MADLTVQERIIAITREQLAVGILPANNESLILWLEDAAEKINERRRKTTLKEVDLSLVTTTQSYALPADCEKVEQVLVRGLNPTDFGAPFTQSQFPDVYSNGYRTGMLPTGQRINGSLDVMRRQESTRLDEEIRWRYLAGKLVLDFPIASNVIARVAYIARDRSVELLPRRYWQMVVTYLHWKAASAFLSSATMSASQTADRLVSMNIGAIAAACASKKVEWDSELAMVTSEVD